MIFSKEYFHKKRKLITYKSYFFPNYYNLRKVKVKCWLGALTRSFDFLFCKFLRGTFYAKFFGSSVQSPNFGFWDTVPMVQVPIKSCIPRPAGWYPPPGRFRGCGRGDISPKYTVWRLSNPSRPIPKVRSLSKSGTSPAYFGWWPLPSISHGSNFGRNFRKKKLRKNRNF